MIEFYVVQGFAEMVFERIQGLEDPVVEGLLAQVVPQVFDWIELR